MSDSKTGFAASRLTIAVLLACGALALTACGEKNANETVTPPAAMAPAEPAPAETTAGEKVDAAVDKVEQAATDAKNKTEEVAGDLKDKMDASASSGESSMKQGAAEAKDATSSAATSVSETVGDAAITAQVSAGLLKDPDLSAIKIDVDTKGGVVTLSGPAPTANAKARAEEIAKGVKGVNSVDNKLEVKPG